MASILLNKPKTLLTGSLLNGIGFYLKNNELIIASGGVLAGTRSDGYIDANVGFYNTTTNLSRILNSLEITVIVVGKQDNFAKRGTILGIDQSYGGSNFGTLQIISNTRTDAVESQNGSISLVYAPVTTGYNTPARTGWGYTTAQLPFYNTRQHVAVISSSNTVGNMYLDVDGVNQIGINSCTRTAHAVSNSNDTALPGIGIGGIYAVRTSTYTESDLSFFYSDIIIYNRILTLEERKKIAEIFKQGATQTFSVPKLIASSSGAVSLSLANLIQAQIIENIALVQNNSLNLASLAQVQTLTVPTLSTETTLALANLAQINTLATVVLAEQNTLTIVSLGQAQTTSSIGLIQSNILNVASEVQGQTLGIPSLVENAIISITNLSQAQTLENLSLTQFTNLTLASISNTQSLSPITLISGNTVDLAQLQQNQSLSNIALTQANLLTVQNTFDAQSLSSIQLAQASILNIVQLVQSQSIDSVSLSSDITVIVSNVVQGQFIAGIALSAPGTLNINSLLQVQTIDLVNLFQSSTLSVNDLRNLQTLQNLNLLNGAINTTFKGRVVFILDRNNNIFII